MEENEPIFAVVREVSPEEAVVLFVGTRSEAIAEAHRLVEQDIEHGVLRAEPITKVGDVVRHFDAWVDFPGLAS